MAFSAQTDPQKPHEIHRKEPYPFAVEYYLDRPLVCSVHPHALKYERPAYEAGCDICGSTIPFKSFRCCKCDYDVCRSCVSKIICGLAQDEEDGATSVPHGSQEIAFCERKATPANSGTNQMHRRAVSTIGMSHPHQLQYERPPYPAACDSCARPILFKGYRCSICSYDLCLDCSTDPTSVDGEDIKSTAAEKSPSHRSRTHEHMLFHRKPPVPSECSACQSLIGFKGYICAEGCSFVLCFRCFRDNTVVEDNANGSTEWRRLELRNGRESSPIRNET